ncbi:equilibrative nucleoside transporter 2-like [Anguilla anguilla]|uniref:equilibrative nucleoside transporter 2-like n=1 Tax=Anguilla anguilla TaxID=7936 RepID=UPI0015B30CD7|nr:equilibrative nucleoside transporter 2-like [Anguilla anguilla]
MTAITYFQARLNSTEWSNGTALPHREYHFGNWLTLLSQLPLLLFTLLNSFLYQQISEKMRIAGSLVCILVLFILNASLVRVPMENDCFFSVTMATIWFINSFGAVMQGSLFGLVGQFPQKYSVFFMSGQGVAGTFATIAMLIAISSGTDPDTAALGYFITPCGGTIVTLSCYLLLPHLPFACYYFNKGKGMDVDCNAPPSPEEKPLLKGAKLNGYSGYSSANGPVAEEQLTPGGADSDTRALLPQDRPDTERQVPAKKSSVLQVFKKIWVMAFSITFVFIVTLSVFPAVTVDVKSEFSGRWEIYFVPVCCFLNFNIMDWLSRTATSVIQWPAKESVLVPILVVARLVFIPLIMLCNVQYRSHLPVVFPHDAAFAVIMMLFSFSSGYFVCLTMSYAPMLVEPKDAETAGALMTFFLALGLSLGAGLSFPLRALV